MGYFHSDKKALLRRLLPHGFADQFTISNVHAETGSFFLRDGTSVGVLFQLRSCSVDDMSRLGRVLADFLVATPLATDEMALTISVYRKYYDVPAAAQEDAAESSGGASLGPDAKKAPSDPNDDTLDLRVSGLLAIVASSDASSDPTKNGITTKLKGLFGYAQADLTARLVKAVEAAVAAADAVEILLPGAGIKAVRLADPAQMVAFSRFFWTAEETLISPLVGADGNVDALNSFAKDFSVVSSRLSWKERTSLRAIVSLRVPGARDTSFVPPRGGLDARANRSQAAQSTDVVSSIFCLDNMARHGTHVAAISAGGALRTSLSDGVSGSLVSDTQAALWAKTDRNVSRDQSDLPDSARPNAAGQIHSPKSDFSDASDDQDGSTSQAPREDLFKKTSARPCLRLSSFYIASSPWDDALGHDFSTLSEHHAFSAFERSLVNDLVQASGGADWRLVDTMWLENLYGLIPGTMKIDGANSLRIFDVTHVPLAESEIEEPAARAAAASGAG